MNTETQGNTCTACVCPCEGHQEHNHPVVGEAEKKVCTTCEHEHKVDGTCNCNCGK